MEETDGNRYRTLTDENFPPPPNSADTINIDDARYSALREDLEKDVQDFEAQTWSLAVDQHFLKPYSKDAIKRQDVIHELVQTEINHVRALKIMLRVYMHETRECMQMDEARLERLFPQLETLLQVHQDFLNQLKQRRIESMEPGSDRNYYIQRVGDILISQFSGEKRDKLRDSYGIFCSHHVEAVNLYKDLFQNNRKFQNLMKKIGQLSVVRRLGVSEGVLLITQRITKYPVLVERILRNSEQNTEEYEDLTRALELIKETITQVDKLVDEYEKAARLRDISNKMEPKSQAKVTSGRILHREDMIKKGRKLMYEGTLNIKMPSGKLKEVLVLLLSDVLVFLQEKDQKVAFASLEAKSPVISLPKLIVREVAHDEMAMFLIYASTKAQMYELYTGSKEERDRWRERIWEVMESCPAEEEEGDDEQDDEPEDTLLEKIRNYQERLYFQDAQIVQHLTEKLGLFAELMKNVTGTEIMPPQARLLLHNSSSDLQQGEQLLSRAISDVEGLQHSLLALGIKPSDSSVESAGPGAQPRRADTFGGFDRSPLLTSRNGGVHLEDRLRDLNQRPSSEPQSKDLDFTESIELSADDDVAVPPDWNLNDIEATLNTKFFDRVLKLSQTLYSLQAIISQYNSFTGIQKANLTERPGRQRANMLLEQEKQRNLKKQREEIALFHRQRSQHQQEQARWEREREQHRLQTLDKEKQLQEREEECRRLEAQLAKEREELARNREDYQQDLERLRESTRAVEKEKERLEQQQKFKKNKTIANPGVFARENAEALSQYAPNDWALISSSGGDLLINPKVHVRPSLSQATAGFKEKPPEVPVRRESMIAPPKTEVPIHLISTTNQASKLSAVQQKIPTKLAATKGKEKSSKRKGSHQRTNSAASIEVSQLIPIKVTGKEGGSLRSERSRDNRLHPDLFAHPERSSVRSSHSENTIRRSSQGSPHYIPTPTKVKDKSSKEDIIFF